MLYNEICFNTSGSICEIILNRPSRRNAISLSMLQELHHATKRLSGLNHINVILLRSNDPDFFSAGGDLRDIVSVSNEEAYELGNRVSEVFGSFTRLPQVVIACMKGKVMGGGAELCLYADIRIAHENLCFVLPEVQHNMIPGAGGVSMLSRISGIGNSLYMLLTAREINAVEAKNMGLVQDVFSDNNYEMCIAELCTKISASPLEIIDTVKRLAWNNLSEPIGYCLNMESKEFGSLLNRFGRNRIEAFFEAKNKNK